MDVICQSLDQKLQKLELLRMTKFAPGLDKDHSSKVGLIQCQGGEDDFLDRDSCLPKKHRVRFRTIINAENILWNRCAKNVFVQRKSAFRAPCLFHAEPFLACPS